MQLPNSEQAVKSLGICKSHQKIATESSEVFWLEAYLMRQDSASGQLCL